MFRNGIGPQEVLIVLGVVLLLFGGKKLPERVKPKTKRGKRKAKKVR